MNSLLITRAKIIESIRKFFWQNEFIETDTPTLVFSPGMEPHICPIAVQEQRISSIRQTADFESAERAYLHTSPEFAMKKILAIGFDRIFQICKCYRAEPKSCTHEPEFTMLEWYRSNSQYGIIMDDCENLFNFIAKKLNKPVFPTFPRFSLKECFEKFVSLDLTKFLPATERSSKAFFEEVQKRGHTQNSNLSWDDYFFLFMMNEVEPKLAKLKTPVIIHSYPETQAALANIFIDKDGFRWAKRFEVYAGGLELANAFDELIDASEQRRRFEKDMTLRKKLYGLTNPIDEDFLDALKQMKPSAGIALGIDRLVMYFTEQRDIKDITWQPAYWNQL